VNNDHGLLTVPASLVVICDNDKACRFQRAADLAEEALGRRGVARADVARSKLYLESHAQEDWQRTLLAGLYKIDNDQFFTVARVPGLDLYAVGGGGTQKKRLRASNLAIAFAAETGHRLASSRSPELQELLSGARVTAVETEYPWRQSGAKKMVNSAPSTNPPPKRVQAQTILTPSPAPSRTVPAEEQRRRSSSPPSATRSDSEPPARRESTSAAREGRRPPPPQRLVVRPSAKTSPRPTTKTKAVPPTRTMAWHGSAGVWSEGGVAQQEPSAEGFVDGTLQAGASHKPEWDVDSLVDRTADAVCKKAGIPAPPGRMDAATASAAEAAAEGYWRRGDDVPPPPPPKWNAAASSNGGSASSTSVAATSPRPTWQLEVADVKDVCYSQVGIFPLAGYYFVLECPPPPPSWRACVRTHKCSRVCACVRAYVRAPSTHKYIRVCLDLSFL
jgi:hypothetical protein